MALHSRQCLPGLTIVPSDNAGSGEPHVPVAIRRPDPGVCSPLSITGCEGPPPLAVEANHAADRPEPQVPRKIFEHAVGGTCRAIRHRVSAPLLAVEPAQTAVSRPEPQVPGPVLADAVDLRTGQPIGHVVGPPLAVTSASRHGSTRTCRYGASRGCPRHGSRGGRGGHRWN